MKLLKNIGIITLFWVAFHCVVTWPVLGQASGKVVYNTILAEENFRELEGVLIFNESEGVSLFSLVSDEHENTIEDTEISRDTPFDMTFEVNLREPLSNYHKVYIDRMENEILSSERCLDGLDMYPCVTVEPTGVFDWNITDETRQIGSFTGVKATTSFRGRDYTAWFTSEIPVNIGPWKFHELPGLILEIYDEEKEVQFQLANIEIPYEVENITPPDEGELISIKKYAEKRENISSELIDLIKAKLPRGADVGNISVNEVVIGIEREY